MIRILRPLILLAIVYPAIARAQFATPLRIKLAGTILSPTRFFINYPSGGGITCVDNVATLSSQCTVNGLPAAAFPLLAPDGTSAAPSYSFASNPSVGMYETASGGLTISNSSSAAALTINGGNGAGFGIMLKSAGVNFLGIETNSTNFMTMQPDKGFNASAGSESFDWTNSTGFFAFPSGNISWTGASTKNISLVSTGAGSSITLTAGAASTWSTSAGALTINGTSGINLQGAATTLVDIGVTSSTAVSMASQKSFGLGTYTTAQLPGTCTDGQLVWDSTTTTVKRCKSNAFATLVAGSSEWTFGAYNSANLGSATVLAQSKATNASTLESATNTVDIVGVGGGNFVMKLCSDGATCAAPFATCTAACTAAVGTVTACTINSSAVAAATTLTWSVATACATADPGINAIAHFTNP